MRPKVQSTREDRQCGCPLSLQRVNQANPMNSRARTLEKLADAVKNKEANSSTGYRHNQNWQQEAALGAAGQLQISVQGEGAGHPRDGGRLKRSHGTVRHEKNGSWWEQPVRAGVPKFEETISAQNSTVPSDLSISRRDV